MCDYCNKGFEIDRRGNVVGYREEIRRCHRCENNSTNIINHSYPKVFLCDRCAKEYNNRNQEMLDKFLVSDPKMDKDGEI